MDEMALRGDPTSITMYAVNDNYAGVEVRSAMDVTISRKVPLAGWRLGGWVAQLGPGPLGVRPGWGHSAA